MDSPLSESIGFSATGLTACVLTLFPDMFPGPLGYSLPGKALQEGRLALSTLDIRDFATDKHKSVDDTPYGGGAGMVMRADIVGSAIEAGFARHPNARLIHLTPRGIPLTQAIAARLLNEHSAFLLLCGRFEGIDERINQHYQPLEISLGDFVLFGGEIAAMALIEAMLRQVPGVVGNPGTLDEESFSIGEDSALLVEYPHYSKPPSWKGLDVPEVLTSGHHERVKRWRREAAERITRERRPDLWERYCHGRDND